LPFSQAFAQIEALKKEAVAAGHLANQGGVELTIGIMQGIRANLNESIACFERARDLFEKVNNTERATVCTLNIGESYRLKGNFTQAHRYFHAAYEAAQTLSDHKSQVTALANEGQMLISMKRYDEALQALESALALGQQSWGDDPRDERRRKDNLCEIHHALAGLYLQAGQPEKAWGHAKESLLLAQELQQAYRLGFAYRAIAEVLTDLKSPPEDGFSSDPDEYFQLAMAAFRDFKAEGELAKTMFMHGKSLAKRGKRMAGARKFQQAMVIFTRLGMVDDAAKSAEMQLEVL
jgi:tetratricopeptide (TPR) repeat protein